MPRRADTVLNYVLLMMEHPSGTIVQSFLMDAPPREGRNSKLCLLSSALSSASMLVSELASGIRLLELVLRFDSKNGNKIGLIPH